MAFNLGALKALFSKLKPAARAVAPVSDDVARGVANYGDDALRAVGKVGDFLPPATVANPIVLAILKERLVDKRLPYDHFTHVEPPAAASEEIGEFINGFNEDPLWGRFPRSTKTLGNVATDLYDNDGVVPIGDDNIWLRKPIDTSQLVVDSLRPRGRFDKQFTLRPHKNTALGRWYDKQVQEEAMIKDSFLYNDPISPLFDLDEFYKGYTFDDGTLPF
jgi:hypothetical protein